MSALQLSFELQIDTLTTTAIYPNRRRNKNKLEQLLGLKETGSENTTFKTPLGTIFATGYNRIVYGDHGPYIEFEHAQIKINLKPKFNQAPPADCYYEWLMPEDGSEVKVYAQKRDVKHLPNPPAGGYRGNRKEGYAD